MILFHYFDIQTHHFEIFSLFCDAKSLFWESFSLFWDTNSLFPESFSLLWDTKSLFGESFPLLWRTGSYFFHHIGRNALPYRDHTAVQQKYRCSTLLTQTHHRASWSNKVYQHFCSYLHALFLALFLALSFSHALAVWCEFSHLSSPVFQWFIPGSEYNPPLVICAAFHVMLPDQNEYNWCP